MIKINLGYECGDGAYCDKYIKCCYKEKWIKYHNFSVHVHNFFEYNFGIKLSYLIYVYQIWKRLSGTSLCPFHKPRRYSWYDCKYIHGPLLRECSCKERSNTPYNERKPDIQVEEWGNLCAYFEKSELADTYKYEDEVK